MATSAGRVQVEVRYRYFDADAGHWGFYTWKPVLTCVIGKSHTDWVKLKLKDHHKRGSVVIESIACNGKVTHRESVHTWV